jgi:sporulation-control protein
MFKRMLSAFGVGGPSVDTVLDSPHAAPGQVVTGQVRIQGGSADAEIGQVVLSLVTRVEVERGDH